jgi:hypothetical protein
VRVERGCTIGRITPAIKQVTKQLGERSTKPQDHHRCPKSARCKLLQTPTNNLGWSRPSYPHTMTRGLESSRCTHPRESDLSSQQGSRHDDLFRPNNNAQPYHSLYGLQVPSHERLTSICAMSTQSRREQKTINLYTIIREALQLTEDE